MAHIDPVLSELLKIARFSVAAGAKRAYVDPQTMLAGAAGGGAPPPGPGGAPGGAPGGPPPMPGGPPPMPGADPMAGAVPPVDPMAAMGPGAGAGASPPPPPPEGPDSGGSVPGGSGGLTEDRLRQVISEVMAGGQGGAGGAAGGAAGQGMKPKMKIDINTEIYQLKKLVIALAQNQGIKVDPSMLLGDPADDPNVPTEQAAQDPASAAAQSSIMPINPIQAAGPALAQGGGGGAPQHHHHHKAGEWNNGAPIARSVLEHVERIQIPQASRPVQRSSGLKQAAAQAQAMLEMFTAAAGSMRNRR